MVNVIEFARRHDEAFNAQDTAGRKAIEASDIETVMPGGVTLRGHDQVMQVVGAFWEALPDGRITVEHRLAADDVVVSEGTLVGTHGGTFRTPNREFPPRASRSRCAMRA